MERKRLATIFFSDSHLGWSHSRADRLASFLRQYSCKQVYIVGDFLELIHFPRKFHLTQGVLDVFAELLRMREEGAEIILIPGNHDSCFRSNKYTTLPGVRIADEAIHITGKYKKVIIFHGDQFDTVLRMKISPLVYRIGDEFYYFAVFMNKWISFARKLLRLKYWSFSHYLKTRVKEAINYLSDFEKMVAEHAKANDCDVVIVGHIHVVADKEIDGVRYINTGSWIESEGESAVLELEDGTLELYHKDEQ